MTKFSSLARARVIGPEGGAWGGGAGEGAAGVDVLVVSSSHSQSTPLDPKLMFWCVSFRSGAFLTVSLLHETWCKMRQTGAINLKVRATMCC